MARKVTGTGTFAERPEAQTMSDRYWFATDGVNGQTPGTGAYYYSDGYTWSLRVADFTDLDPYTEASLICGVSSGGGINPIRISANGGIGGGNASFTDFSGSTDAGSKLISSANASRKFLFFQNLSDTNMYLGIGGGAATPNSMLIPANGGGMGFDALVPTNAIYVYCGTAGKKYVYYEA